MTCFVPTCLRAKNFLTCQRAKTCYVSTCQRAKFPYVPTCHDILRANLPMCQVFLRANVPCRVTCQRAKLFYVPTSHCMLRANMHSSCLPCANLPTCQFVTSRSLLMLIFLHLPRVQLLNLLLEGLPNYLVRS